VWNDKNLRQEILAFNTAYWMSYKFMNLWRVRYQNSADCEYCDDGTKASHKVLRRRIAEVDRDEFTCNLCYFNFNSPFCCVGCGKDGQFPENRDGDTTCKGCMSDPDSLGLPFSEEEEEEYTDSEEEEEEGN